MLNSILNIFVILFLIGLCLFIYMFVGSGNIMQGQIDKVRDEYIMKDFKNIKEIIEKDPNKKISNLREFNVVFDKDIRTANTGCYYLDNSEGVFIFAAILESRKYIKENGGEKFLYKSDDNYVITDEEMSEIENVISNSCRESIGNSKKNNQIESKKTLDGPYGGSEEFKNSWFGEK